MNNSETNMKKENFIKIFIKRLLNNCKKHKFITAFIVIVLAVTMVAAYNLKNSVKELQEAEYSFVRTTTLSKDGLETAVNVTGSVESSNTSTVSYSVGMNTSAPKIKIVNVAVGDYVEEGDVIVVLDNTDILENITEQKELLAEKLEELAEKYTEASDNYEALDDELDASKAATDTAYSNMVAAQNKFDEIKNNVSIFQTEYDNAVKTQEKAGIAYNSANAEWQLAVKEQDTAKSEADAAATDVDSKKTEKEQAESAYNNNTDETLTAELETTKNNAATALEEAENKKVSADEKFNNAVQKANSLKEKHDTAKSEYDNAVITTENAKKALDDAKKACNYSSYESAYNSAVSSYNSAKTTKEQLASKVEAAYESKEQAYENYLNSNTSDILEDLQEQLENCNLKAETSGKVTALSAVIGNTVNGTVATIQDTESLKIAVTIGEADINTVEIGMKCKIRSDATEGYISGTLTQIDPVSSMGGSFGAEITVNGGAQGLLIGMNADVDIIVSEVDDCFTVPADSIGEDEQGKFIYRYTSGEGVDLEFEKVYITVGESNDYYVEISSDELAEGDVIRSYSDLTIGIETVTGEDAAQMQGFGNIFGGMGGMSFGDIFGGNGEMPSMPDGGSFPSGGGNGERPQMPGGGGNGGFSGGNGGGMP